MTAPRKAAHPPPLRAAPRRLRGERRAAATAATVPGPVPTLAERAAGLLLHPTSLAGPYGNGDLGDAAYRFAEFAAAAGQRWWQMLPVHPVGEGHSPYNGLSAFAGAPHLIALEPLVREGWLRPEELVPPAPHRPARAADGAAHLSAGLRFRESRLRRAFARYAAAAPARERRRWEAFRAAEAAWLDDYALFVALKRAHGGVPWTRWPAALRARSAPALRDARRALADEIAFRTFVQYQFHRQWEALRRHCHALGVGLLGDVPIFVAHDSADAWAHRELFFMDRQGRRPIVAGVPPDAFSASGQRWGNPLYDWARHRATGYAWWKARLQAILRRFDAVRLDHFIAFVRYWAIPGGQNTARHGRFRPGPGAHFLSHLQAAFGHLPLIAEDLGLVTPAVTALRQAFGLPGMRVLQFAFGDDDPANPHRVHNHDRNSVVYTGTHDNETLVGWARGRGQAALKPEARRALAYLGQDGGGGPAGAEEVHWALIRMAYLSVANLAVVPVQDVLGLGNEARMNTPGTPRGNWTWRLAPDALTDAHAARLAALARQYGRAGTVRP
jgi:4-alpha-glucanotransferase